MIYLSLKDIKEVSWKDCSRKIHKVLSDLFDEYKYLRDDFDQRDLKNFDGIWLEEADGNYFDALKDLSKYLSRYHEKKVVILLDEYDTPMVSAYENGYYEEAMRKFLYILVLFAFCLLQLIKIYLKILSFHFFRTILEPLYIQCVFKLLFQDFRYMAISI